MNREWIIGAILVSLIVFVMPLILSTQYEYVASRHQDGHVYQVNRWTGNVRVITGDRIRNIRDLDSR